MEQIEEAAAYAYEVMKEVRLVRVRVPSRGCLYLEAVPDHSFKMTDGKTIAVPAHYKHGQKIGNSRIIVNRHFYDVTENDLGRTIIATVKVVKKMIDDRVYIMLDITKEKAEGVERIFPKKTLKIYPAATLGLGDHDIRIPMTGIHGGMIRFEDYTPYVPEKFRTSAPAKN